MNGTSAPAGTGVTEAAMRIVQIRIVGRRQGPKVDEGGLTSHAWVGCLSVMT